MVPAQPERYVRTIVTRTSLRRVTGAFLALTFVLAGATGAAGARPCAHHDGMSAEAAHVADGHDDHATSVPSETAPKGHGGCACLGDCAAASAVAIPEAPRSIMAETPVLATTRVHRSDPSYRHVPYLVPFAHAPPASA